MLLEHIIKWIINLKNPKKLAYRINYPNAIGLKKLEQIDYIYLFINSFIEYTFVLNVLKLFSNPLICSYNFNLLIPSSVNNLMFLMKQF